jgi:hypothetical protein
MIRKRLHRRWTRELAPEQRLLRLIMNNNVRWSRRYNDWFCAKYGENQGTGRFALWRPDGSPLWLVPVSMFLSWMDDWAVTWSLRPWAHD